MLEFAKKSNLDIKFYSKEELNKIETPNVTPRALKEFGIKSVAEASSIIAANGGKLILEKEKYEKVTIAISEVK